MVVPDWSEEQENPSTSIFWHSGNCLHDTDKVIFIVTELPKHIKQAASHDLPRKQQELQVSRPPANTYKWWVRQRNTQHWQSCQVHYTNTHVYLKMTRGLELRVAEHEKHDDSSWTHLCGDNRAVSNICRWAVIVQNHILRTFTK